MNKPPSIRAGYPAFASGEQQLVRSFGPALAVLT